MGEASRIGALEGIDRLLLVADGEDGPLAVPRAGAGEELRGQGPDDVPLLRRSVLGLVDQHMIDAAVELVEHPGRVRPLLQQVARAADQVGEVEPARLLLGGVVERDIGRREAERGDGIPSHPRRFDLTAGAAEALLLFGEPLARGAIHRVGAQPRLGLSLLGAEGLPEIVEPGLA